MKKIKYFIQYFYFRLKEESPKFFNHLFWLMVLIGSVGFGLIWFRKEYPADYPASIPSELPGYFVVAGIVGGVFSKLTTLNPFLQKNNITDAVKAYKDSKKKEENKEISK